MHCLRRGMSQATPRSVAAGSNVLAGASEAVPEPEPIAQHSRDDDDVSIHERTVCGLYTHGSDSLEHSPSKTPSRRFWDVVMRENDDAGAGGPSSRSRMVKQGGIGYEEARIEDEDLSHERLVRTFGNAYTRPPSSPVKLSSVVLDLNPWKPVPCKPIVAFPSPFCSQVDKENGHQDGKPRKGPRRWQEQDGPHTFVCGINGCDDVLDRHDFTRVRAHLRFNPEHANDMIVGSKHNKCLFSYCDFKSNLPMRVAEHICSQAHFSVPVPCCAPACKHSFAGRSWAMTRHRNDVCVFCEGCNERFKDAELRKQHEATCRCIPQARAARNRRKCEIEQEEVGGARRRRSMKPSRTSRPADA